MAAREIGEPRQAGAGQLVGHRCTGLGGARRAERAVTALLVRQPLQSALDLLEVLLAQLLVVDARSGAPGRKRLLLFGIWLGRVLRAGQAEAARPDRRGQQPRCKGQGSSRCAHVLPERF